jgi:serine/threonine protein kinase
MHALEKSPLKRPQSAKDFSVEFEDAASIEPSISPDLSRSPELKQLFHSQPPSLIPVVKQQNSNFSIVEYVDPELSKTPSAFSSGQFKTNLKQNWHYIAIGAIILVIIILIVIIIILLKS